MSVADSSSESRLSKQLEDEVGTKIQPEDESLNDLLMGKRTKEDVGNRVLSIGVDNEVVEPLKVKDNWIEMVSKGLSVVEPNVESKVLKEVGLHVDPVVEKIGVNGEVNVLTARALEDIQCLGLHSSGNVVCSPEPNKPVKFKSSWEASVDEQNRSDNFLNGLVELNESPVEEEKEDMASLSDVDENENLRKWRGHFFLS
ncbi:hypothetical protein V6N13_083032 [Hibiscus sabdariffa]|uniref:Uncharacterized protein n=2 Tax=Hibiscus sabdariffa TaxID=183260 RepID=A0ABR2BZ74_9ROSI